MYLGKSDKVKMGKVAEIKKLLSLNHISRISYSANGRGDRVKTSTTIVPKNDKFVSNILPLKKSSIKSTAEYGKHIHPIYGIEKMHNGIDFAVTKGTSVFATADVMVDSLIFDDKGIRK